MVIVQDDSFEVTHPDRRSRPRKNENRVELGNTVWNRATLYPRVSIHNTGPKTDSRARYDYANSPFVLFIGYPDL